MPNWLPRLTLLALFLLLVTGPATAQEAMILPAPDPDHICTLESSGIDAHHHVTSALHAGADAFATAPPSSTFEVTFVDGGCGGWPQEAIDAVTFATEIWGHHLTSDIPIRVEATWDATLPNGTLGSAGPRAIVSDASLPAGVGRPNTWYPIAQASAMANTDFAAQFDLDMDIRMRLNCNRNDWYFETDAAPPAGTIDFVTVVLHELGHGIGFLGTMSKEEDTEEAGWGRTTSAGDVMPLVYDVSAEDTATTRLIDETVYPNPSEVLFDVLRSDAVFAGGVEATAANDNERPPLFAPSTWQPGSSFSHLDTDTFAGTENALMRHQIDRASAVHSPGPVVCGMLADMEWPLGSSCDELLGTSPSPALALSPLSLDFGVVTEGSEAAEIVTLTNTSEDATVTGEITTDGTDFTGLSGTGTFSLAPGETRAIEVQFAPTAAEVRSGTVTVSHDADVPDSPLSADLTGEGKAAPVVAAPIDDQMLVLDGDDIPIDLTSVFENTGADPTFTATSEDTDVVAANVNGAELILTAEGTGTASVTVTVDDGTGGSASDAFTVEVVDTTPALALSPSSVDFGLLTEGSEATDTLILENTSTDSTVTGEIAAEGTDFTGLSGTGAFSLAPGETRAIEVQFAPTAAETRSGTVIVSHDADVPDSPITADLAGEGKAAPVVAAPIDDQMLVLDGDDITIDLASVFENAGADPTFTATSEDAGVVAANVNGTELVLTPEGTGTASVTVTVDDGTGGSASDAFTVEVIDTTPALALSPSSVDFGVLTEGTEATDTVTLENTSTNITVTGEVTVEGTDFTGLSGTGAFSLEPGDTRAIEVQFAPTAAETRSGTVIVSHDADVPDSPLTADLAGEGKAAPVVAQEPSDEVLQLSGGAITIDLEPVFENVGDDPIYTAVSDDPAVVSVSINGTELRLTAEGPGDAAITIAVDDNSGGTATTAFQAEVNQAPVVSAPVDDQILVLNGDPLTVALDTVFTDPDGDNLEYSAASDNVLVATAAIDNGLLTVEPLLLGEATISLEASDGRGGSTSNAFIVTVVERQPPVVTNPIADQTLTLGGAPFSVNLDEVFDSPEGDALTYTAEASPAHRVTLTLDDAQLTVAAALTGAATVTATATDEAGATAEAVFAVAVDALTVTVQQSFADASDAAHYRLVALPGAVDLDIAETLPGTTPGTSWRAFRDTGGDEAEDYLEEYRTNSADFRFQPGRGFWLLSSVDWAFDEVVDAALPDDDGDVHVPLHPGWNTISNPTSLDLAWMDVREHNNINEGLWQWNDGAWTDLHADTLRSARTAGEAFYFFNAGGANALETLRLPTEPSAGAGVMASARTKAPTFTLTLTHAGESVSRVHLGEAAKEQTYAAPPAAFGSMRLALEDERPLAGRRYTSLQDRAIDLTVTAAPGTDLTLTVADLAAVLGGQEAVLLEPATGQRHDLQRTAEVPLRITAEETPLRLLIGSPAFIDDAAPPPPDLRLTRLYPNPSARAVTIEFSLPRTLPVQLDVFDVLGRQVARLHEGELGPGIHAITWDGLLRHGTPAASGVYLVRLQAGGETRTKRLTRLP